MIRRRGHRAPLPFSLRPCWSHTVLYLWTFLNIFCQFCSKRCKFDKFVIPSNLVNATTQHLIHLSAADALCYSPRALKSNFCEGQIRSCKVKRGQHYDHLTITQWRWRDNGSARTLLETTFTSYFMWIMSWVGQVFATFFYSFQQLPKYSRYIKFNVSSCFQEFYIATFSIFACNFLQLFRFLHATFSIFACYFSQLFRFLHAK